MEKRRIQSFDSLKGLAVLFTVTIGHYWQFTPADFSNGGGSLFDYLTNILARFSYHRTHSFMELLLMVSGFQMFSYYYRITEEGEEFGDYLKKRITRLFPMTVITTLVMVLGCFIYKCLTGELWSGVSISGRYVVENLLNVQSWLNIEHSLNGPLWYVSVYFFCCILFYVLSKIGKKTGLGLYIMLVPILFGVYLYEKFSDGFLQTPDLARGYIGFFAGVFIAYVGTVLSDKVCKIYICSSLVIGLAFYTFCSEFFYTVSDLDKVLVAVVLIYCPFLLLCERNKLVDKVVGNKILTGLGRISYSLYVWNFPFYLWLAIIVQSLKINFPYEKTYMFWVTCFIQIGIAALSYYFIEKPIYKKLDTVSFGKCRNEA